MKQIMKFLCSLIVFTFPLFGDGWNSTLTSQSTSTSFSTLDNVANKDGIHVVRIENGSPNSLKYQLLNSAGTLVRTTTIDDGVSNNPVIVSASNSNIFTVYIKGTQVIVKQSTDVGQNWTSPLNNAHNFETGYTTSYGIDAVIDGNNIIHVVYSIKGQYTSSELFYRTYDPSAGVWANFKNITDQTSMDYGREPAITLSSGKVHVTCTMTESISGAVISRDKAIPNDSWETPIQVNPNQSGSLSSVSTDIANEYVLYTYTHGTMPPYVTSLMFSKRSLNGSSWDTPIDLHIAGSIEHDYPPRIINTADGNIFAFYIKSGNVYYRRYNNSNSSWETEAVLSNDVLSEYNVAACNTGNDIFVNWMAYSSPNNLLKYRQYNATPLTPQDVAVGNSNNNPLVTWTRNPEPDIAGYDIYRDYVTGLNFVVTASASASSYNDPDVYIGSTNKFSPSATYYVIAKDVSTLQSPASRLVSIKYSGLAKKDFAVVEMPEDFSMNQNFPNPFNPTTTISYGIPEAGTVHLTVYDALGREVATLVNEYKNAGYYETNFDAGKLSSGIYFYKLQAGNFTSIKKMSLIK